MRYKGNEGKSYREEEKYQSEQQQVFVDFFFLLCNFSISKSEKHRLAKKM